MSRGEICKLISQNVSGKAATYWDDCKSHLASRYANKFGKFYSSIFEEDVKDLRNVVSKYGIEVNLKRCLFCSGILTLSWKE